ncbi:MAG: hypothetical protein HY370_02025 [Proteobacteria bacterium]|nr:hypothetical protein [Pseudomonadota bacterium]
MTALPALPLQAAPAQTMFDTIRRGCEVVAQSARYVHIRHDKLPAYAARLPNKSPRNVMDAVHHYIGAENDTISYILALDSINFGSGYQSHLVKEGWKLVDKSIYFTLATKLKEHYETNGPYTAAELARLTPFDVSMLLGIPMKKKYGAEFVKLCTESLNEIGHAVADDFGGRITGVVAQAGGSVEKMVRWMIRMHHFNDIHRYRGHVVPFYKRAQITAGDLHLAYGRMGRMLFHDIEQLTMFPDNGVPHVLHVDGILEYDPKLAARIAAGKEIPSESEEEIEIRACALHAVELIAQEKGMIPMTVDHILWHRSVETDRYLKKPAHRTLSRFY